MHTIAEIIKNQNEFKEEILISLKNESKEIKKIIKNINSEDNFIKKEKNKLEGIIKKTKFQNGIKKLFFLSPNRSRKYYAWWDKINEEVIIYCYEENQR